MNIKILLLIIISIIANGCVYKIKHGEQENTSFINIKEIIEKNRSEEIVGFWQIEKSNSYNRINEWLQLVIVPNCDKNGYQFKGIIVNPGSLFNKGIIANPGSLLDNGLRSGETILYVNKIGTIKDLTNFSGIWNNSTRYYFKEWKSCSCCINSQSGFIYNSSDISYTTHKYVDRVTEHVLSRSSNISDSDKQLYASSSITPGYGEISKNNGRAKTVHVRGYHRKDGTYVKSHYRSPPKR